MGNMTEALKNAIEMEKKGYEIYMRAARNTKNNLGRITLEAIAVKELEHIKAISQFASNISSAIGEIKPKEKRDYIAPIMARLEEAVEEKVETDLALQEAYEIALGLEKEAYAFYQALFEQSGDPQSKNFFQFLMQEENTHYELLSDTLEYLTKPAEWFKKQERWVVEG
jgi:rubrerythrin